MNGQLTTDQLRQVGGGSATMSHCPWCGNVWTSSGEMVDPKPEHWASLPEVVDSICQRLEAVCRKEPVTREDMANAGVVRQERRGRKTIAAGRSCLPVSDRD